MKFDEKVKGAIYGAAIGDAMGAPVEGAPSGRIFEEFPRWDCSEFLPPPHGADPDRGKGSGRITDDTLMTEVLIEAYAEARQHLDAYGYCKYILPRVKGRERWIPEWQSETVLWNRLYFPEKFPWIRLGVGNADPRTGGVGNVVNCGVAMWMMPVGAVNAGHPRNAYQEAVLLGSAHSESFAVEAGAVMAAATAEALSASGTPESVLGASVSLAKDGTKKAIAAVAEAVDRKESLRGFISAVRAAVAPYDPCEGHVADDAPLAAAPGTDVGRPSRVHTIEELPVALAALVYGGGDALRTLRAAVFYGRDCDSIGGMAMALFGALYGAEALPNNLYRRVDEANRRDFTALSVTFCRAIREILEKDRKEFEIHAKSVDTR